MIARSRLRRLEHLDRQRGVLFDIQIERVDGFKANWRNISVPIGRTERRWNRITILDIDVVDSVELEAADEQPCPWLAELS